MTKRNRFKGLQPGDEHPQESFNQQKLIPWTSVTSPTSQGAQPPPPIGGGASSMRQYTSLVSGAPTVATGKLRWYPPYPGTIVSARASLDTTATGATTVDVRKNGASIFTNSAHRPSIASGANTGLASKIDVPVFVVGDYFQFDIAAIGSPAGSDLSTTLGICVAGGCAPIAGSGTGGGSTPYSSVILGDGPVGYWRFGESSGTTLNDSSGNGHNGTYHATFTLGQTGALANDSNTAVLFSSGYANVPDSAALEGVPISLEMWVKLIDRNTFYFLMTKETGSGGSNFAYEWRISTNGHQQLGFAGAFQGNSAISTGSWHHLVATRDGIGNEALYLDGAADGTNSTANQSSDPGKDTLFGSRDDAFSTFNGSMDEAAIYNYVLTPAKVLAHYNAGIGA